MTLDKLNIPDYKLACNMNSIELKEFIYELENSINKILGSEVNFEITLKAILKKLESNGHKLFRLDYNNDIHRYHETWGMNYRNTGTIGLEFEFRKPGRTKIEWIISTDEN